jgi:putative phosphoribosyl transferase
VRFTDPRSAGLALASKLEAYGGREETIVLALARGGVAVGLEVSKRLRLPLDLILLRRLLVSRGSDSPVCASSLGGALFVDEELDEELAACSEPALGYFVAAALAELDARVRACRGDRPTIELKGTTIVVVDNGVRTGSTMRAAVRALRSREPARIVAAVPVADAEARTGIEAEVEEFVCLASPEPFGHVGLWYADFRRPDDDEIRSMLEESERGR